MSSMTEIRAPKSIFISYAHRDGRDIACRLHDDLTRHGYRVWMDTHEIESGASWTREIEEAIDNCDVTLALLSRASYLSEICRAEQLRSLRKGKRTIPIRIQSDVERPLQLESIHYLDFTSKELYPNSFTELLTELNINSEPLNMLNGRKGFLGQESLPKTFVARDEDLKELRNLLLRDNSESQVALTALRGLGGIGKTIMALKVCKDDVIQDAFPDGVVWVDVGKAPQGGLLGIIKSIFQSLEEPFSETDETGAKGKLRQFIARKSILIVLDDVWNQEYIKPFLCDAPRCKVLITTRGLATADLRKEYGIAEIPLGKMTPKQSVDLLTNHRGRSDPKFENIAEKVGYLPLALKLVGSYLNQTNLPGDRWLESYYHVSTIVTYGTLIKDRDSSVKVCIDVSTQELGDRQPMYHTLGVFAENAAIPIPTVIKFWRFLKQDLSENDCWNLILLLEKLALIEISQDRDRISLHNLLHDYNVEQLNASIQLENMHRGLLQAYHTGNAPRSWHLLHDDGYLYDHLVYHLKEIGEFSELGTLFDDQKWMESRVKYSGYTYDGYVADLLTGWDVAFEQTNRQIESQEPLLGLVSCVRYALISSSIRSLAANQIPELVACALELDLEGWTARRALSIATSMPDEKAAEMYKSLLNSDRLTDIQREDVEYNLRRLQSIMKDSSNVLHTQNESRVKDAPLTSEKGINHPLIVSVRSKIYRFSPPRYVSKQIRTALFVGLATFLSGESIKNMVKRLKPKPDPGDDLEAMITDERSCFLILTNLLPKLDADGREIAWRQVALTIEDVNLQAQVFSTFAQYLSKEQVKQAIVITLNIRDENSVQGALSQLRAASQVAGSQSGQVRTQNNLEPDTDEDNLPDMDFSSYGTNKTQPSLVRRRSKKLGHGELLNDARDLIKRLGDKDDTSHILRDIRRSMNLLLRQLGNEEREELLTLCTEGEFFRPPILSVEIIASISKQIEEICQGWRWL